MKPCPFCSEEIQEKAKKCKHCGEWLDESGKKTPSFWEQLRSIGDDLSSIGYALIVLGLIAYFLFFVIGK